MASPMSKLLAQNARKKAKTNNGASFNTRDSQDRVHVKYILTAAPLVLFKFEDVRGQDKYCPTIRSAIEKGEPEWLVDTDVGFIGKFSLLRSGSSVTYERNPSPVGSNIYPHRLAERELQNDPTRLDLQEKVESLLLPKQVFARGLEDGPQRWYKEQHLEFAKDLCKKLNKEFEEDKKLDHPKYYVYDGAFSFFANDESDLTPRKRLPLDYYIKQYYLKHEIIGMMYPDALKFPGRWGRQNPHLIHHYFQRGGSRIAQELGVPDDYDWLADPHSEPPPPSTGESSDGKTDPPHDDGDDDKDSAGGEATGGGSGGSSHEDVDQPGSSSGSKNNHPSGEDHNGSSGGNNINNASAARHPTIVSPNAPLDTYSPVNLEDSSLEDDPIFHFLNEKKTAAVKTAFIGQGNTPPVATKKKKELVLSQGSTDESRASEGSMLLKAMRRDLSSIPSFGKKKNRLVYIQDEAEEVASGGSEDVDEVHEEHELVAKAPEKQKRVKKLQNLSRKRAAKKNRKYQNSRL